MPRDRIDLMLQDVLGRESHYKRPRSPVHFNDDFGSFDSSPVGPHAATRPHRAGLFDTFVCGEAGQDIKLCYKKYGIRILSMSATCLPHDIESFNSHSRASVITKWR